MQVHGKVHYIYPLGETMTVIFLFDNKLHGKYQCGRGKRGEFISHEASLKAPGYIDACAISLFPSQTPTQTFFPLATRVSGGLFALPSPFQSGRRCS